MQESCCSYKLAIAAYVFATEYTVQIFYNYPYDILNSIFWRINKNKKFINIDQIPLKKLNNSLFHFKKLNII